MFNYLAQGHTSTKWWVLDLTPGTWAPECWKGRNDGERVAEMEMGGEEGRERRKEDQIEARKEAIWLVTPNITTLMGGQNVYGVKEGMVGKGFPRGV